LFVFFFALGAGGVVFYFKPPPPPPPPKRRTLIGKKERRGFRSRFRISGSGAMEVSLHGGLRGGRGGGVDMSTVVSFPTCVRTRTFACIVHMGTVHTYTHIYMHTCSDLLTYIMYISMY